MTDDILDRVDVDTAAERCQSYELFGQPIEPYTPQRAAAAMRVGMTYPLVKEGDWFVSGEYTDEATGEKFELREWRQLYEDSIIVGYLCTLPKETVRKVFRNPDSFHAQAFEWAEKNDIAPLSPKANELARVFVSMLSDAKSTQHRAKTSESADNGPTDPN